MQAPGLTAVKDTTEADIKSFNYYSKYAMHDLFVPAHHRTCRAGGTADSQMISGAFDLQASREDHSACIAFKLSQIVVLQQDYLHILI